MKRLFPSLALLILCAVGLRPVDSQSERSLADWAPADSEALLTLNLENPDAALNRLNVGAFVGAYLQPTRPPVSSALPFDAFVPLDMLDLETASFARLVLPWLGDSLAVAYRTFHLPAGVNPGDVLLILPTRDFFAAAAGLSSAVEGQDLLRSEISPVAAVYLGDRSAIALTPSVVLIGSEAMVRDALAVGEGQSPSLAETDDYQAVLGALPDNSDLSLFARSEAAASALPALLSLDGEAEPLLASYGAVLNARTGVPLPAGLLMQGDAEALGVALDLSVSRTSALTASVALLAPDAVIHEAANFQPDVLNAVPRSAMLVFSTADAALLADAILAALPYSASGPGLLSALPLQVFLTSPPPDPKEVEFVLDGLLSALEANGVHWDDVLTQLSGSALVVLLPRPNNPLPVTLAQADILLAVESVDADALAESVNQLLTILQLPVDRLTADDGSVRYQVTVEGADEPVLQFGTSNGLFLLGTGRSIDEAQRALAGDNRLIDQPRWETAGAPAPGLYLDMDRLYNTFLPTAGGATAGPVNRIGVTGDRTDDGLYQLSATVVVTLTN
ncbi:MAG: hypothetical protein U0452_07115 [Anaerolineae bacterium]